MKNFVVKKNHLLNGKWFCKGNHACIVSHLAMQEGYDRHNYNENNITVEWPDQYLSNECGLDSSKLSKLIEINDKKKEYPTLQSRVKAWRPILKELGYRLIVK